MGMTYAAMIQPLRGSNLVDMEKRHEVREPCRLETTSRPLEVGDAMGWGGTVKDLSAGGLKLQICFPFRPGTYLAVELPAPGGAGRSFVCRVVHVHDHSDGTWTLGCKFLKPLTDSAVDLLV
jgi:hypothetical protein